MAITSCRRRATQRGRGVQPRRRCGRADSRWSCARNRTCQGWAGRDRPRRPGGQRRDAAQMGALRTGTATCTVIVVLRCPEDARSAYTDAAVRRLADGAGAPKLSATRCSRVPYSPRRPRRVQLMRVHETNRGAELGPNDTPMRSSSRFHGRVAVASGRPPPSIRAFARRAFRPFSNGGSRIVSSEAMRSAASRVIR